MASEHRIRVLCVDDNPLVAEAVATKLKLAGGFQWSGHLTEVNSLIEEVEERQPDIILMDLDMPGEEPFEKMRLLTRTHPDVRVLILSGYVRKDLLDRAIEYGAWGYLSKNDDAEALVNAIRRVAEGEFVLGPELTSGNALM